MYRYTIGITHGGVPISLTDEERRRHIYVIGRTGSGKSVLLQNLMRQDLLSGRGFALIDPHGDLARSVADLAPRPSEVIYFDPLDTHVVSFNPLSHRGSSLRRAVVASEITAAFKHVFSDFWGPRMEYILKNALRLLLDKKGSSLIDLPRLLIDDEFRLKLIRTCEDGHVKAFWQEEFSGWDKRYRKEAIGPIQNKAGQFATDPILRAIVGRKSTIDIRRIMDSGRVLLCNFSKAMGEEPSHLLGALLTTAFYQAAAARADTPEHRRRDFTLYVDEFQNFATDTFATILSEARKYRLNLVLAHQFMGQLPTLLRQSVIGNAGAIVAFRVGAEDALLLSAELGTDRQALLDTPSYQAWFKRSDALLIKTLPPPLPTGSFPAILRRTRARHARPRFLEGA